jgi:agmatinase
MKISYWSFLTFANITVAHSHHDQSPLLGPHKKLWYNVLPGDGGTQVCKPRSSYKYVSTKKEQADSVFSGISTFGRIAYHPCLASDDVKYDIAFIGRSQRYSLRFELMKHG